MSQTLVSEMERNLLSIDRVSTFAFYRNHKAEMPSPHAFAESVLTPALERIGTGWENGSVSLSQIYMAGRICEQLIGMIVEDAGGQGDAVHQEERIALAVFGDRHFLGKRIVASVLQAAGITITDFGFMESAGIVERTVKEKVDVLLISTLMLPSALAIKDVVQKLRDGGSEAKIVVGGAPFLFDDGLWKEVGADAMGKTASDAVKIVRTMIGGAG